MKDNSFEIKVKHDDKNKVMYVNGEKYQAFNIGEAATQIISYLEELLEVDLQG